MPAWNRRVAKPCDEFCATSFGLRQGRAVLLRFRGALFPDSGEGLDGRLSYRERERSTPPLRSFGGAERTVSLSC